MKTEPLEARAAIADLIHRYALNIRNGNATDCAALFTEDVIFEVRDAPLDGSAPVQIRTSLKGRDTVLSYLVRAAGSGVRVCPMIHNLLIQVGEAEASSSCVMTAIVSGAPGFFGEYQDTYRFEGSWCFASRSFTIFGAFGSAAADGNGQ